jgi:hypothetical protein
MRFLADENFNNEILRGVRRRMSDANITRVQDTELAGSSDPDLLAWAATYGYIVLSHDVNTMRGFFYERLSAGLPVPGLFLVQGNQPIGAVIESLELIIAASDESEWAGAVFFLPL